MSQYEPSMEDNQTSQIINQYYEQAGSSKEDFPEQVLTSLVDNKNGNYLKV